MTMTDVIFLLKIAKKSNKLWELSGAKSDSVDGSQLPDDPPVVVLGPARGQKFRVYSWHGQKSF